MSAASVSVLSTLSILSTSFLVLMWGVCVVLCIPSLVLVVQVVSAFFAQRSSRLLAWRLQEGEGGGEGEWALPRFAVIMPAHNESQGIAQAIQSVLPQCGALGRLIVVADNCSDDTAQVARAHGAQVIERTDLQRRGKGYALDFGVRHLAATEPTPEVVVMVDADCELAPGALKTLVLYSAAHQRPVQALYLMQAPPGAGLKVRLAEFAWVVKNWVRPLGYARWGLPCQLMGTGMAFPWKLIEHAPVATGHIVEDMQLGLDLAVAGSAPLFCPWARVSSVFPSQALGIESQRTRWEHGHLSVIATQVPRLLGCALKHRRVTLLAMALDLGVPPLASLVLMLLAGAVVSGVGGVALDQAWPLALVAMAFGAVGLAVGLGWYGFARHIVGLRELLSVPAYVCAKVPLYLRFLLNKGPLEWVRTKRDAHANPDAEAHARADARSDVGHPPDQK